MIEIQNILIPILTAVLGYLAKFWLDQKSKKTDNFNQISQQAYQKLFDQKIEAYNKIAYLGLEFMKFDRNYPKSIDLADINKETASYLIRQHYIKIYETYQKFDQVMQDNFLILSTELSSLYVEWKTFLHHQSKDTNEGAYQIHASDIDNAFDSINDIENEDNINSVLESRIGIASKKSYRLKAFIMGEQVEINSDKFNEIIRQAQKDILRINKRINRLDI